MRNSDCIFCKIAHGEIPSATVYEDEDFRAILDLSPASAGHVLIITKQHYRDILELDDCTTAKVLALAKKIGTAMKDSLGCPGFNIVQNNGIEAGQTVFHFHMHVIPRYGDGTVMVTWEPQTADASALKQIAESIKAAL